MSQPFDTITITLSVQLGQTKVPIHQLLRMGRGAVIELDARETDDVLVLAGEVPIARGQVVLRGEHIGVSITEVLMRRPEVRPRESVKTIERQTEAA